MFRPIREDHTNCLQVAIKTHSFFAFEIFHIAVYLLVRLRFVVLVGLVTPALAGDVNVYLLGCLWFALLVGFDANVAYLAGAYYTRHEAPHREDLVLLQDHH